MSRRFLHAKTEFFTEKYKCFGLLLEIEAVTWSHNSDRYISSVIYDLENKATPT